MPWRSILPFLLGGLLAASGPDAAAAQVLRLAELNAEQIRALDRARTVVIMPGGVLEQHGPYLPSWTDGYYNERIAGDLAAAIVRRPGWTVVMFPPIPLGAAGANEIGNKPVFPGSYSVRPATLRAVYMDLASALGDDGFRWIFVVNSHGGPFHGAALDQAGDFFRDTYGGRMVSLGGIPVARPPRLDSLASPPAAAEDGFSVHAGLLETSIAMALRPDLVQGTVGDARSITGRDFPDLIRLARASDWPGYFGAPRYATAAIGRAILDAERADRIAVALRILDGADERTMPRTGDRSSVPGIGVVRDSSAKRHAELEARQQAWLARRRP